MDICILVIYLDITKTFDFINSKKPPWEFYTTTGIDF